ncbi:MAG: right-handed parallel beta-helix repeat-containing protein, partial [Armatimonadota bacterium]
MDSEVVFANETHEYRGRELYNSAVTPNIDTRWIVDVRVDKLVSDVGEASTGLVLMGYTETGSLQRFYLVYQWGQWSVGYQPVSTEPDFSYWRNLGLRSPIQHFELSISADGRDISLENDKGFHFRDTLSSRLFGGARLIATAVQIGPQTKIALSKLVIEQLQESLVQESSLSPNFVLPTPRPLVGIPNEPAYVFHVAVNGDDANPGTEGKPFATIEHARDVIRTINSSMQGSIIVLIHGGTYFIQESILFGPQDSGQNGFDVIYRAAEGEQPVISGGRRVTNWEQIPNSPVWKASLENPSDFRQMYVNGVRAKRAVISRPITGIRWANGHFSERDGIVIFSSVLPEISRPQDLELHWIYDWKDMRLPVENVTQNPDGTTTIWMQQPYFSWALWMGEGNNGTHQWFPKYNVPFYVENALELLDEPGEWYYNPDTHELFYRPREGEDLQTAEVIIPQGQTLMEIKGYMVGQEVHNLIFEGLTFAYAGWTRANERGTFGWQAQNLIVMPQWGNYGVEMTPAHIQVDSAHHVRFERCRFEHLGAVGLYLGNNVFDAVVQGNLFQDISDGAIVIGHWDHAYITSPSIQAAPHDVKIANNLITNVGVEYWGAPAITA